MCVTTNTQSYVFNNSFTLLSRLCQEKRVERCFPISNASTGNLHSVSRACYVIHQLRLGRTFSNTWLHQ